MKREQIVIGRRYTYHPTKDNQDNLHPACIVDSFTKSGRVRIKLEGDEKTLAVSPRALSDQVELFAE
jgi:hypothetical protein